jgi:hypothetical protein
MKQTSVIFWVMNKTIFFNVSFKSMKQVLYKIKIKETISKKKINETSSWQKTY